MQSIEYNSSSPFSPEYFKYTFNPQLGNIEDQIRNIVVQNPQVYSNHTGFLWKGSYGNILGKIVDEEYDTIVEDTYYGPLQYHIGSVPQNRYYGRKVIRPIYIVEEVGENTYKQISSLDRTEEYTLIYVESIPLYIGANGAFFLSQTVLNKLPKLV